MKMQCVNFFILLENRTFSVILNLSDIYIYISAIAHIVFAKNILLVDVLGPHDPRSSTTTNLTMYVFVFALHQTIFLNYVKQFPQNIYCFKCQRAYKDAKYIHKMNKKIVQNIFFTSWISPYVTPVHQQS